MINYYFLIKNSMKFQKKIREILCIKKYMERGYSLNNRKLKKKFFCLFYIKNPLDIH